MITNDVQYRTAKAQIDRLQRLRAELEERPLEPGHGDLRRKLETAAVESQVSELRAELDEYDELRSGHAPVGRLTTLDDLPRILVRARIAAGMSQKALAQRMGLKEQQIQRYESSDYSAASLSRLREVATALNFSVSLPDKVPTSDALVKQLSGLGLDRSFVRRRIAPAALREAHHGDGQLAPIIDLASRVGRVFGMDASSVLAGAQIEPDNRVLAAANFKIPKGATTERVAAYTVYAHYVALLVLQASEDLPRHDVPSSWTSFRQAWHAADSSGSFEGLVRFVWNLGIPVVPLADSGTFHAAVWRAHDREVIVLKQGARRSSRWAFDLLHEIGHIIEGLNGSDGGVIDADESSNDPSEETANSFAGDVLLDGRAEELVQLCVTQSQGSVERLKSVVPRVASSQHVDTSALANYLAFRLSMQDINWWGTATNLQTTDGDPWSICRDVLIERSDLAALNPLDRELLNQALAAS
jgi:transcriptional regulator with XRE-family HTH domain